MNDSDTSVLEDVDTRTVTRQAPRYSLILLNDDVHSIQYVCFMLTEVFGFKAEKAVETAMRVHEKGEDVVYMGALEVVELKDEQIRGYGPDIFANIDVPLNTRIEEV